MYRPCYLAATVKHPVGSTSNRHHVVHNTRDREQSEVELLRVCVLVMPRVGVGFLCGPQISKRITVRVIMMREWNGRRSFHTIGARYCSHAIIFQPLSMVIMRRLERGTFFSLLVCCGAPSCPPLNLPH